MANSLRSLPASSGSPAGRSRTGFSLVELLVALAIIALLVALLIPAIQAARESSRMVDCKNRLRQIALGLRLYESARKHFPAGIEIKSEVDCLGLKSRQGSNWLVSILPYEEERAIHLQYQTRLVNEAPENRATRTTYVSAYSCPNDGRIGQEIIPEQGPVAPANKANLGYMSGSYRGISGVSNGFAFLDSEEALMIGYEDRDRGLLHAVGVGMGRYRAELSKNITDGESHTLMVGESYTLNNLGLHTAWAYSYKFYALSAITEQSRTFGIDYDKCIAVFGDGGKQPCQRGWSASHPSLLNFASIDASVHSLHHTIDLGVLARMATIAGGESTPGGK